MSNTNIQGFVDSINNSDKKGMMTANMSVKEVFEVYELDDQVNRELSKTRIPSLVKYIEGWKDSIGIYFPALVFSYRGDFRSNFQNEHSQLHLGIDDKLTVLDGQHRIHAMVKYYSGEQDEKLREEFLQNHLTVQIYIGLTIDEEKTLFSDINSHAKRVHASLITQYDSRDPINVLVRHLYNGSPALQKAGIEMNKKLVLRPNNTYFCHVTRLKQIVTYLLFNKRTLQKKEEKYLECKHDKVLSFLVQLFDVFFRILPETPGDVNHYVLGHEAIQSAIAQFLFKKIIVLEDGQVGWKRNWEREVLSLQSVDWCIENPDWERWMVVSNALNGREHKEFPYPHIRGLLEYIESKASLRTQNRQY
ncbi:DNA sulfur modification protein DndB [Tumebacillus permanentifrigoris]|uniref:DNA sulfur modification protein DndB n=1 Tax=Tumebacillus permanentifrigoris TaxID=378543 RepID=A0A316E111_9BACL|nr:DNA sulfur modification protein DndB [Tumebacillus permanentifrigoris]PWK16500.1 DNA sulfur modification protein DndB [Tumebacillus permanentifrigoris]